MTLAQICQALEQSIEWGRARVQEGMPHRKLGKRLEFSPAEVKEWLIANGHAAREPVIVATMQEVADYFDVSTKTVQNWKAKGMPHDVRQFDLGKIDVWRQALIAETVQPQQGRIESENQLAEIKVELARLELDEARKKLVPVEAPKRVIVQIVHAIRTHVEQFPDRLHGMLPIAEKHKAVVLKQCKLAVADLLLTIQAQLRQAADEISPETEDGADE